MLDRSGSSDANSKPDVSAFALKALATLLDDMAPKKTGPDPAQMRALKLAIHAAGEDSIQDALHVMRAAGITNNEIVGLYVPAVANLLESDWQTDRVNFVGVTIASARLQGIVRRLAPDWLPPTSNAPRCLVTVPQDEQHTLGASVLTAQLRQQGLDVQLLLDASRSKISELAKSGEFTAVMISSYDCNDLEPLRAMVKTLRASNATVPILVGGSVLNYRGDVCRMVRADYATNNLQEAIRICGLKSSALLAASPTSGR